MFGLHRLKRIEGQATLKAVKKKGKNDNQTNTTPTHSAVTTTYQKNTQNEILFPAGKGLFFNCFDLGAQIVPKEPTKLPREDQGTPNGRPKVHTQRSQKAGKIKPRNG